MQQTDRGFTLVEIIIVTSILGILLLIGIFGYGGYVNSSQDRAREADTRHWASTFDLYKSRYAVYPVMSSSVVNYGLACLGKFASTLNRCGAFNNAGASYPDSNANDMLNKIQKIGKAPINTGTAVNKTFSGPIAYVTQTSNTPPYTVTAHFLNYFINDCPQGFTDVTSTNPFSSMIPSPNGTHLCRLQQSFTYDPN